jgi:Aromatic amino acid lyase
MRSHDLTRDRYVCAELKNLHAGCDWGHGIQVEVAHTIWDLLKGSKFAGGHEKDVTIEEDQGELRQDRYTLRTAPQFLGPQIEDIISALDAVTIECNSSTLQLLLLFCFAGTLKCRFSY